MAFTLIVQLERPRATPRTLPGLFIHGAASQKTRRVLVLAQHHEPPYTHTATKRAARDKRGPRALHTQLPNEFRGGRRTTTGVSFEWDRVPSAC